MKSKQEIKQFFENGDIPNQEQFWEWQDSYWHKDEKLPLNRIEYDFSKKADLVDGKVPASQLPSYVDDVLEFNTLSELPAPGESGKIYITTDTNKQYRWSGTTYVQIESSGNQTLQNVITNGNYAPRFISFTAKSDTVNETEGSRDTALGANPSTYSFFFGNMNPAHTGTYNISMGYNSLPIITTGQSNTAIGHYSGQGITTGTANTILGLETGIGLTAGNDNTLIGISAGYGLKEGSGNAFLGKWSGCFITGNNNTFLGYKAGQFWGKGGSGFWSSNIVIGGGTSGHGNGMWGENNIIIGSNIEMLGANNNRFIINNFLAKANRWYDTHFIEGNFADKWLKFDTSLQVLRLPQADNTFSRNLVAKPDGTFGWTNNLEEIPLSGTSAGSPITGDLEIDNLHGTKLIKGNAYGSNISFLDDGVIEINNTEGSNVRISGLDINATSDLAKGIVGDYYYGRYYTDNSFIQKKYVDQKHSYSSEEILTGGTWINGKPVYKKTVFFDAIPHNGEIDITPHFKDLEVIVSNQMFTEWYAMDIAFAGNQWKSIAFISLQPDMVKFELAGTTDTNYSVIDSFSLTLEYTKK
ncbi:hypothetical protein M2347_001521 [Chryseobacterium sp. H1D6B]|uniref:hypothetical protein n=1 Tax=Chryseobacterium sp. H1D6B TaxID=2940588 RepID=UPI001850B319|nr:hypothetical protein [Chryseobacterium sp. H1D6B]MDH6251794.1 hypothetical protein [Chryseobacterium sp. H1D6B]